MAYENLMMHYACPGNLSDTSTYNIDGACVAQGDIEFGSAVRVVGIVDGMRVVTALSDGETPYGIAFRSQYEHLSGKILDGEVCNVVSQGRVWALTSLSEAPKSFSKLRIGVGGVVTGVDDYVGWTFAGGFVKHEDGHIIEVQVKQNALIVPPPPPPVVLVESATINTDKESPQPNNAPVKCSITVEPGNATDKTGVWSVDAVNIATIDADTGILTPVGSDAFGSVNVNWTANDGSKTKATIVYQFEKAVVSVASATVSLEKNSAIVGEAVQASVVVAPEGATNKSGSWSLSSGDFASVDPGTGLVTTIAAGEVDVIWTAADGSGVKGQQRLTITDPE
ncbi:hypothetical protein SIP_086 [Escherichia phage vB_Eco_Sip]|uniref:BIG2 domain-containing protein n=1 Tax=Escherichia phage vB_Eco_Sip TaxID=2831640 RepID=A0AAD1Q8I9_9CAUD|nr:hypothetical protein SIP_086 [Escherichia phage vB_Eco_Sip]